MSAVVIYDDGTCDGGWGDECMEISISFICDSNIILDRDTSQCSCRNLKRSCRNLKRNVLSNFHRYK
jgi:hypothetical protein